MKRMTCKMCGSTDLLKQDGVFACQFCGTKYSVEDAKKMMVEVEGTVKVTGTFKVDTISKLDNLYEMQGVPGMITTPRKPPSTMIWSFYRFL